MEYNERISSWSKFVFLIYCLLGAVVTFLMAYGAFMGQFNPVEDVDFITPVAVSVFEFVSSPFLTVVLIIASITHGILCIPAIKAIKAHRRTEGFPYLLFVWSSCFELVIAACLAVVASFIGTCLEYTGVAVSAGGLYFFEYGTMIAITLTALFVIIVNIFAEFQKEKPEAESA